MPKKKSPANSAAGKSAKRPIEQYDHKSKTRLNNPPVGLVTEKTDPPVTSKKSYAYDPHLDPQLVWAGKKEHTSFEVPTVSLHVHERIDPRTIIEAVRKRNGVPLKPAQGYLFESREENPPLREAVDFYSHAHGWTNRLIAGDSLLVMNSLLEKEGLAGQVQMVYIDPPYGIRYGSNFQPFVNRRDVKDGKDEDLTQEPEMVRAFRDTWELGIHSYLTYLRDRLLLARDLLSDSGSVFVQIGDENPHHVREILDEVFGSSNAVATISFAKTSALGSRLLPSTHDFLLWYSKSKEKIKYTQLFGSRRERTEQGTFTWIEEVDGSHRRMTGPELRGEVPTPKGRRFRAADLTRMSWSEIGSFTLDFNGQGYTPPNNRRWATNPEGMKSLIQKSRVIQQGRSLAYKLYEDDFPWTPIENVWEDTIIGTFTQKHYVVQTSDLTVQRCILMTTDPGDLVLDPTCGGGTTAVAAEQWGRRWITCDTSRVATTLAKQRLMSATFDYYKKGPHVTLKSIANNEPPGEETLYDQPLTDNSRARISGPFTVEAVPAPNVKSLDEISSPSTNRAVIPNPLASSARGEGSASDSVIPNEREGSAFSSPAFSSSHPQQSIGDFRHAATPLLDASIARSGPTLRQSDWRDELLKSGIRGKSGQMINFSRVEPLGGTRWLHADAETKVADPGETGRAKPERAVISFGPDYAPLETRQVEAAWHEARTLHPQPDLIIFASFQFDPEAAKDIDELTKEKTGMTFLTAQMNADLLTDDLKKKRSSNQSFWLIGRPDVEIRPAKPSDVIPNPLASSARGEGSASRSVIPNEREGSAFSSGLYIAEVHGFDYFNARTGSIESGGKEKIAMWLLDTDYDDRSLYPRQVFFPMADDDEGWAKLARNLKAEIDLDLIEKYRGTVSLPFALGSHKRVAIKVIDDRGIESLKVVQL